MNLNTIQIKTKRLALRPITNDDAPVIFREFTPEITVYMFPKPPEKIEETQAFITSSIEQIQENRNLQLVILHQESRDFLGCAGIHHLDTQTPEIGIWLKKAAHGVGYGLEVVWALMEWAREHVKFDYIKYPVAKRNMASLKIPIKLNATKGPEYTKLNLAGFELDEVEYRFYSERL